MTSFLSIFRTKRINFLRLARYRKSKRAVLGVSLILFVFFYIFRPKSDVPPPMIIYSAYFHYVSHDTIGFQAIGYSFCQKRETSVRLIVRGVSYALKADELQIGCPDDTGCEWANYRLYAELPSTVIVPRTVTLTHSAHSVTVAVSKSLLTERKDGLEACVAPLYLYNRWVRLIEFIELYRSQGVTHLYVYVSSVSVLVMDVLLFYEKQGTLTVVRWPDLPKYRNTDPNSSVFRVGQGASHADCMLKSKAKFVAVVDLDDYIQAKSGNILDYLNKKSKENPEIGSFVFKRAMVRQPARVGNLTDWRSVDFAQLEQADICKSCQNERKPIVMPDRVDIASTHRVWRHRRIPGTDKLYRSLEVPARNARAYHARFGVDKKNNAVSKQLEQYVRMQYFSNAHVGNVRGNFTIVMEEISKKHKSLLTPDTSEYMNSCTKYISGVCQTPYHTCPAAKSMDQWYFVSDDKHAKDAFVIL